MINEHFAPPVNNENKEEKYKKEEYNKKLKEEFIQNTLIEVNNMINFKHPHLLGLFESFIDANEYVSIVCEYGSNGTLLKAIEKLDISEISL